MPQSSIFTTCFDRKFSSKPTRMASPLDNYQTKVYFDVTWQGPVLDSSFRPTGKVQGEFYIIPKASAVQILLDLGESSLPPLLNEYTLQINLVVSPLVSMMTQYRRRQETLSNSAQNKTALATRAQSSTGLSQISCFREGTSHAAMYINSSACTDSKLTARRALAESQFTARSSQTRTLR